MAGTLYVVATPIGNLNDISKRALEVLESVDIIACEDTRQSIKLLNHYNIKNKLISYHKFNEKSKSSPCISDPGYNLVKEAREKGISVFGIPGCSATVTALSISGLAVTNFSFIGFMSNDTSKFNEEIDLMHESRINTFIIYESPKRLVKLVTRLNEEFVDSNIFIANDLTKIHERGIFGKTSEVLNIIKDDPNIEKGEYVVVLEKKEEIKDEDSDISLEALLVDTMKKNGINSKDAIKYLTDNNRNIKKNDLYKASLNLKDLIK